CSEAVAGIHHALWQGRLERGAAAFAAHCRGTQTRGERRRQPVQGDGDGNFRSGARHGAGAAGEGARHRAHTCAAEEGEAAAHEKQGDDMNEFRKEFEKLNGRFADRSGATPKDENRYWPPIVVTGEEIEREVERLADLPRPANGRRESLVLHPYAEPASLGMAPGIQVK